MKSQVPGITCITPRALADETIPLLNPLSCQAIALASEGETPCAAAIWAISPSVTLPGVGLGAASGTTVVAGAGVAAPAGCGEPVGSLTTVPVSSRPAGSRPFIVAIESTDTPAVEASPES